MTLSCPLSHAPRGNGYINLCLAVLVEAKAADDFIWRDFKRDNPAPRGDGFETAVWVADKLREVRL